VDRDDLVSGACAGHVDGNRVTLKFDPEAGAIPAPPHSLAQGVVMSRDWETKIDYSAGKCCVEIVHGENVSLPIVRRIDKHEDESESEYYYLELTKIQYEWILAIKKIFDK